MTHNPLNVLPRLHMGCGESLHSKLLLGVAHRMRAELAGKAPGRTDKSKTTRGRTRG